MLLYGVLHHEINIMGCLYICLYKIQDTAQTAVAMVCPDTGLTGAGCTCTPLAENPRAQDQLPPGTRAEYLIWDLASPTSLLC